MKRTLLTIMASSMLVFALPAVASASHGKHHHGARHSNSHRHHAKGARLLTFAPAAPASGATTPTAPTTPADETAGTVTSFTNGVLTITLTDGTVTIRDRDSCRQPDRAEHHSLHHRHLHR